MGEQTVIKTDRCSNLSLLYPKQKNKKVSVAFSYTSTGACVYRTRKNLPKTANSIVVLIF